MRNRTQAILTCTILAAACFAAAPFPANAAGLLVADGPLGTSQLAIKSHEVNVTLNNGIAVTTVTQVFQNQEGRPVEALYTFPVPRGASISNFSLWINGKEMTGEVVEKKYGRSIYDSYKEVRRDPGLLEQKDFHTFEMRIAPIAANAQERIEVTYTQALDFDHDTATYIYPLETNTKGDAKATTAEKFFMTVDAKSAVPITEMASPSHRGAFVVTQHSENYQKATLEVTAGDLQKDIVLTYHTARPQTGVDIITSKQPGQDGYFYLTLTAGQELLPPAAKGMDYVFLLDVSGSMGDDTKLQQGEKNLDAFVRNLGPDDTFQVMAFNRQAYPLFDKLTPADDAAKAKAIEYLDNQQSRGGTTLAPALAAAYKYAQAPVAGKAARPLNVILISDGMTDDKETPAIVKLIKERPQSTRVFCVGVGDNVNHAVLEQMADISGGLASFLSVDDDFTRQAAALHRKLIAPAATNLNIEIAGADIYDVEPKKLPNLYFGTPVRVFGRYKNAGLANVNVTATLEGKPFTQHLTVNLPAVDNSNPEIERMWAWTRIDRLQKEADAAGPNRDQVIPEITRLGQAYSIVTQYTSFLVLENDTQYERWHIDRTNALRIARDRAAEQRLSDSLAVLREKPYEPAPQAHAGDTAVADDTLSPIGVDAPTLPISAPPTRDMSFDAPAPPAPVHTSTTAGAFDPLSALALTGLGVLGILATRRKKLPQE